MRIFGLTTGLFLASLVGALLATLAAFSLTVLAMPRIAGTFPDWLADPAAFGWWPWPIFGAVIGGAACLARELLRDERR